MSVGRISSDLVFSVMADISSYMVFGLMTVMAVDTMFLAILVEKPCKTVVCRVFERVRVVCGESWFEEKKIH